MMERKRTPLSWGSVLLVVAACIGLMACSAERPPGEQDQAALVVAALQYVAHEYPFEDETLCFDPLLTNMGLDMWRETLEDFRTFADHPEEREAIDAGFAGGGIDWLDPTASNGRYDYDFANKEVGQSLAGPMSRILSRTPSPVPYRQLVPVEHVPKPLLYKPHASLDDPDCSSVVSLSGASVEGDTGFVETAYVCGPLCGGGAILALRRTSSGWRVIARAGTWVS